MSEIFRKIFESSPVAKVLVDVESKIRFINERAEKLFGYHREELIGQDVSILVPSDIRQKHPDLVKSFFDSPSPRKIEAKRNLVGIRKNGTSFPAEIGLNPIETEEGLLVMSSIIDLTVQFYAEERFRSAVESAPNGMLIIDAKGSIILVNKQIEDQFGYSRGELLRMPIEALVPDEFREHHPMFVDSYIRNPVPRSMGIGRELFGKKKDGTLFPVEIGLQPLKESEDSILVLASIVDITKRREAEREIEEKSEELQEFAYRTSHDLKAPLSTISTMLQCIEDDIKDNDLNEALTNIKKVGGISKNLHSLVQTILFLTKADMEAEKPSPFDFNKFIEDFKASHGSQIEEKKVALVANFIHNKEFHVPRSKLSQIVGNLLSNAIKFSNPSLEERVVRISTYDDSHWFYLQVKDNGVGIPKEKQKDVFSMFKRFHHGQEGHGIGLYMVKKFVSRLNGDITFESDTNGTCFYLRLPHQTSNPNS